MLVLYIFLGIIFGIPLYGLITQVLLFVLKIFAAASALLLYGREKVSGNLDLAAKQMYEDVGAAFVKIFCPILLPFVILIFLILVVCLVIYRVVWLVWLLLGLLCLVIKWWATKIVKWCWS